MPGVRTLHPDGIAARWARDVRNLEARIEGLEGNLWAIAMACQRLRESGKLVCTCYDSKETCDVCEILTVLECVETFLLTPRQWAEFYGGINGRCGTNPEDCQHDRRVFKDEFWRQYAARNA